MLSVRYRAKAELYFIAPSRRGGTPVHAGGFCFGWTGATASWLSLRAVGFHRAVRVAELLVRRPRSVGNFVKERRNASRFAGSLRWLQNEAATRITLRPQPGKNKLYMKLAPPGN